MYNKQVNPSNSHPLSGGLQVQLCLSGFVSSRVHFPRIFLPALDRYSLAIGPFIALIRAQLLRGVRIPCL